MSYVEVAVDAPVGFDRTLTYASPRSQRLIPGQMVWVPLGQRVVQGVVFQVTDESQFEGPREVLAAIEPPSLVAPQGLALARWLSRYYLASLFEAVSLMLPPGFRERVRCFLEPVPVSSEEAKAWDGGRKQAWELFQSHGRVEEEEAKRALGQDGERDLAWLRRRGFLRRAWQIPGSRAAPAYDCYLRLSLPEGFSETLTGRSPRQASLLDALVHSTRPVPISQARKEYGAPAVEGLLQKGLVALEWVRKEGRVATPLEAHDLPPIVLTAEQEAAVAGVAAALEGAVDSPRSFLLHGVTGSGKTEVYLRALERCVALGKQGILLVPEIALTPQTVASVNARFPGRVALIHSGLPAREQFDRWWQAHEGGCDVVVGTRSALFAPLARLGLIVMDEEHEWTYKEQERSPRYHVREAALKLAALCGAVVLMGSATPDVGTYYQALRGRHRLLTLPYRIAADPGSVRGDRGGANLARVEVRDMRQELKDGNTSPLSRALAQALEECLSKGEQAILFLNRRGAATLVQCRDCGGALRCRSCTVTLTYHPDTGHLVCHHCNRRSKPPTQCPSCRSPRIRYLGLGTQRLIEELKQRLPHSALLRWDRDAASGAGGHQAIMDLFSSHEAQVLVGTQMVAKGLHVPNVSLVGVILADIGLNLPDFRAGERAFQLLCQVAGRAGRGVTPGRVIIQTYSPQNYAIQAAAGQDYRGLFDREIEYRRQQGNPPFSRLVHMVYLHTNENACQREAQRLGRAFRRRIYAEGLLDLQVVGPAPSHPRRVRGRYRWHLILRGRNPHAFLDAETVRRGWTVDVDPVTVL